MLDEVGCMVSPILKGAMDLPMKHLVPRTYVGRGIQYRKYTQELGFEATILLLPIITSPRLKSQTFVRLMFRNKVLRTPLSKSVG